MTTPRLGRESLRRGVVRNRPIGRALDRVSRFDGAAVTLGDQNMLTRMRKIIARASQLRERYGVAGVLRKCIDKVVLRRASLSVLHVLVLEPDDVRSVSVDSSLDLRFLTEEEVIRFAADPTNEIGPEFTERIRGALDLCFGAIHEGRLASYSWYALGSVEGEHAAGADLGLPADTAYLYKGFTHPDFRGSDLYPACMSAALLALRPCGIGRLIALVHWSNEPALRSCGGAGCRRLGRLVVGPLGPIWIPVGALAIGVRFGAHAKRAIAARRAEDPTQRRSERAK